MAPLLTNGVHIKREDFVDSWNRRRMMGGYSSERYERRGPGKDLRDLGRVSVREENRLEGPMDDLDFFLNDFLEIERIASAIPTEAVLLLKATS